MLLGLRLRASRLQETDRECFTRNVYLYPPRVYKPLLIIRYLTDIPFTYSLAGAVALARPEADAAAGSYPAVAADTAGTAAAATATAGSAAADTDA